MANKNELIIVNEERSSSSSQMSDDPSSVCQDVPIDCIELNERTDCQLLELKKAQEAKQKEEQRKQQKIQSLIYLRSLNKYLRSLNLKPIEMLT